MAGGGGAGPALTHISSQYPPAKLTAVLKAPTAGMKAAGMVPLTLSAADMKSLVTYVGGLGGASTSSKATPAASRSASPAPGKAKPAATVASSELNGEEIFKAQCASCHGINGVGATAPRLRGQNSSYLANQLLRFRDGDRANSPEMTSIAKRLDKEQIRAVAAFLSSQ
jgi:cytochrome c553